MKMIPLQTLRAAEAEADTPVKRINGYTAAIFGQVANLKAAAKLGKSIEPAWEALREILNDAAAAGDMSAFVDLQKALSNLNVSGYSAVLKSGTLRHEYTVGTIKNPPRRPVTKALIQAIDNLQWELHRAPTRQEILDEMNRRLVDGVDETEVSSQLAMLGWSDLIPTKSELAS